MPTEADTCRKFIVPKLQAAGWDSDPHSIAEQRCFTDGRIVVRGNKAERKRGKRADYLLRYTRDFPIAVTEAKAEYKKAADGLQQAKDYAKSSVSSSHSPATAKTSSNLISSPAWSGTSKTSPRPLTFGAAFGLAQNWRTTPPRNASLPRSISAPAKPALQPAK